MSKKIIIAIHGVGETKKGSILYDLAESLQLEKAVIRDIAINGEDYKELVTEDGANEIIEINWSDLMQPQKKLLSVIKHVALLMTSMLAMAQSYFQKLLSSSVGVYRHFINPAWWFRWLMEGFMLASLILPVLVSIGIYYSNKGKHYEGATLMFALSLLFGVVIWKAVKYSNNYKLAWIGFAIALLYSFLFLIWGDGPDSKLFNNEAELSKYIANWFRTSLLFILSFIWFFTLLYVLVRWFSPRRHVSRESLFSHLAFFYIPYIVMNTVGTILTLSVLFLLGSNETWGMRFDLKAMEIATTIIYSVIGLIPSVIAVAYVMKKDSRPGAPPQPNAKNEKGVIIQKGLNIFLLITPFLLLALSVYLFIIYEEGKNPEDSIVEIYKISILRVLPYITWVVGPLAIVADVVGDILFYTSTDKSAKYRIKDECQKRVLHLLEFASKKKDVEIILVAHSWGSVIAYDVLSDHPFRCRLITLGSPLESLCQSFLANPVKPLSNEINWVNGYRYGDYIAGRVTQGNANNLMIGPGGHTDYWVLKAVANLIKE